MTDMAYAEGLLEESVVEGARATAARHLVWEALEPVASMDAVAVTDEQHFVTRTLDAVAWDALLHDRTAPTTRRLCAQAFALARAEIHPDNEWREYALLRAACLGWLADETTLALRLLNDETLDTWPNDADSWLARVERTTVRVWLLLLRKRGWADLDQIDGLLAGVRRDQAASERPFLEPLREEARGAAWELASHYHLLKSAEVVAEYLATGAVSGEAEVRFDPKVRVQSHMDRASSAALASGNIRLEELGRLLALVSQQVLDNSLWAIARGVNPLTRRFVSSLVDRGRQRPLLELLPPQRLALAERGLARAGQRSVVVSMPTSSGKTLIAEFRMLQALNAFEAEKGWVAYIAPTRALVNQVTRRLRSDFAPLGLDVEKVSPALEVDGIEADLFSLPAEASAFRVLVTTPEKLDLLLRSGWQDRLGRPLCLVVVDEAHNLNDGTRGLRLELLLATINREARDASFLLLTPFVQNANDVAQWLDAGSSQSIELSLDWSPNDKIIALAERVAGARRGDYGIALRSVATTRATLEFSGTLPIGGNRPLGLTFSQANSPGKLAAATAAVLGSRGQTITLAQKPAHAWGLAKHLADNLPVRELSADVEAVLTVIADEFGHNYPLIEYIKRGIGVHHSGVGDEVRAVTEYLIESGDLVHLVATTTVAEGVNFPVANVVLASHQFPYGQDMPPSDFWNLAGRAGRVDQGQVGIIALASPDEERSEKLRQFVGRQVERLNSTLIDMVAKALQTADHLDLAALSWREEWSAFVQYLAHSYRQIGNHDVFASEVEQVLRGTLGFQALREADRAQAFELVRSVRAYAAGLAGKPLALVDSTGFSWESVNATLGRLAADQIDHSVWDAPLFSGESTALSKLVGVMMQVPELRAQLAEVEESKGPGTFISKVVTEWVNGTSLPDIAEGYFRRTSDEPALDVLTRCCSRMFKAIAPTVAWGLSAMQAITLRGVFDDLPPETQRALRNLPSFTYYGVNNESAVALRLLGVPRGASTALVRGLGLPADGPVGTTLTAMRARLEAMTAPEWTSAVGEAGPSYRRVWQMLNGH